MRLTVAGLGAKHVLDLEPEETIRNVKARLEALTSLSAAEMRLLVKGKAPEDATKLGGLGLSDGAKIMLMRSAAGAKVSGGTSSSRWMSSSTDGPHTTDGKVSARLWSASPRNGVADRPSTRARSGSVSSRSW